MEKLKAGNTVWFPCEVKPGPFPNERSVLVRTPDKPWVGFVEVRFLKELIASGKTSVRALIVEVRNDRIVIALPGQPLDSSRVRVIPKDEADRVPLVPVPA